MNIPENLKYSKDHEWVLLTGSIARVGITDYAQDALGDVVFVQLPTTSIKVEAGASCSEVESTKSVSDIYVPVSGTIVSVNDALTNSPNLVNTDPYGDGWIMEIEVNDFLSVDNLMNAAEYRQLIEG
ncbi:MAG: glycine cleavage system protein GcvH [Acidimicrobiaceae bacterium]|nr:glycine cleavage system protein GcvH [Acidimicrobiaceae bacterium]